MSMFRRTTMFLLILGSAATLTAAAGPPWISVEYPANPHDPDTRGALMVVRTYHHGAAVGAEMSARALATVERRRVTVPLEVRATSRAGVYAIRGALPGGGASVVTVTRGGGRDAATALIAMDQHGEVLAVRVPHRTTEDGRWLVPRAPTAGEIETLLAKASAMDDAASSVRVAAGAGAALLLLLAVPSGAWIARRRRDR